MANKHGDYIWYELLTSDADAAQKFYGEVVGWKIVSSGQPGMDYRGLETGSGMVGGLMQITPQMRAGGARPVWLGYIGVADVDDAVASIVKVGGKIMMPAFDIPNVGRIAMVADPQGVPFYVMRGASDGTSTAFSTDPAQIGHCAWNELLTTDQPAAFKFYSTQFGWKKDGDMDMGAMGKYEFLRHGPVIGAMMTKPAQMPVPMWNYYFRIGDIDKAATRVKAAGGQIMMGPMEVPGGDWVINGMDPQGAAFALVGKRVS